MIVKDVSFSWKHFFILSDEVQVLSEQLKTFLYWIGPTLLDQPCFWFWRTNKVYVTKDSKDHSWILNYFSKYPQAGF